MIGEFIPEFMMYDDIYGQKTFAGIPEKRRKGKWAD